MEKIQENICKQACSYVFVQENYIKAHVLMYFLHLMLTFTPHYIIMVKGLFARERWYRKGRHNNIATQTGPYVVVSLRPLTDAFVL